MTNIGYWSNVAYPVSVPRTFITSSYFGTLGYAYPTALGAKVALPDKRVVALCGDGGFMYNLQELSTAGRYGINAVAVVFNNHAYGASMWDQTHQYGGRFIGTDLNNPDFVKAAEAFGVVGMKAQAGGHRRRAATGVCCGRAGAAGSGAAEYDAAVPDCALEAVIVGT